MNKKVEVDKSAEFAKRLAKIHGPNNPQTPQDSSIDIGREELQAMVDVFVGENYDRKKFEQIAGLKKTMGQQQVVLYKCLDAGEISPEQYLDLLTALLKAIFRETKRVMGARDYQKLFGKSSTPSSLIDRELFLKCESERKK